MISKRIPCLHGQMFVMITILSYPMVFPFPHHYSRSETSSWVHARTREFNLLRTTINAILTIIQCTCAGIGSFYRPFIFFKYGLVTRDPVVLVLAKNKTETQTGLRSRQSGQRLCHSTPGKLNSLICYIRNLTIQLVSVTKHAGWYITESKVIHMSRDM